MPKLTKEKFDWSGTFETDRTTYKGDIELYLHYDNNKDYFYFEFNEYKKYLLNEKTSLEFRECKSKRQAMLLMKSAISETAEKKRFLRVQLNMKGDMGIEKEKLSEHLQEMTTWRGASFWNTKEGERRFSIDFYRVLRIGNDGNYVYAECDENWDLPNSKRQLSHWGENLIDWDEQTELFLIEMQNAVDRLCGKITTFFNTKDVSELKDRINNTPLMLNQ